MPVESAKIADKDIVVYKLLVKYLNGAYYSPWRDAPYEIGKLYTANVRYYKLVLERHNRLISRTVIEEGLHAYTDKSTAILMSMKLPVRGLIVVKGIIPKGAMYVLGKDNEIVSTQLKLIDKTY